MLILKGKWKEKGMREIVTIFRIAVGILKVGKTGRKSQGKICKEEQLPLKTSTPLQEFSLQCQLMPLLTTTPIFSQISSPPIQLYSSEIR